MRIKELNRAVGDVRARRRMLSPEATASPAQANKVRSESPSAATPLRHELAHRLDYNL